MPQTSKKEPAARAGRTGYSRLTKAQLIEIAKMKSKDLNTEDMNEAIKIIEGTARQMGVEVK